MVSIAPNRALICGRVTSVDEPADLPEFLEVTIEVERIDSVEESRNMFRQMPGDSVKVLVPRRAEKDLGVRSGAQIEVEARRADLHRSFAYPERIRVVPEGTAGSPANETTTEDPASGTS